MADDPKPVEKPAPSPYEPCEYDFYNAVRIAPRRKRKAGEPQPLAAGHDDTSYHD